MKIEIIQYNYISSQAKRNNDDNTNKWLTLTSTMKQSIKINEEDDDVIFNNTNTAMEKKNGNFESMKTKKKLQNNTKLMNV